MKKIISYAVVFAMGLTMMSCDDFLNDNRFPPTKILNTPEYWSNANNCQLQVDRYIDELSSGYGSGNSLGTFYFSTLSDDQVGSSFANWHQPTIPPTDGNWSYSQIRGANYIINGVRSANPALPSATQANYEGIGKLIRAQAYYELVRRFGDVVWESEVVDPSDNDILYGPRTNRDIVMDSVLRDLNYAIATISTQKSKLSWSKDLALAIKSEVCLYEGTFCRYRTVAENGLAPDDARAKKYLQEAADASKRLLDNYGFASDYQSIYNSVWGGGTSSVDPTKKLADFSANPEIIFGRRYDKINGRHSTISYTCSSTTTSGLSLDAFKAFLFLDGKPAATTSLNTSLVGENTTFSIGGEAQPAYSIQKLLDVRDKRLSVITDPYIYYLAMPWSRMGTSGMNSSSGFGIAKYDNVLIPVNERQNTTQNYTCAPIYWTSYIALNYVEAKAELGTLTDGDVEAYLNVLYRRAGLPAQTVAGLNAINDPRNNMGVSSLIFEIRRCRRCELMLDKGLRYWDLIRWHQLDKLDSQKNPDILRGAYVGNATVKPGSMDGDYVRPYVGRDRIYDKKFYLDPIPSGQLDLHPNLGQNPGWK